MKIPLIVLGCAIGYAAWGHFAAKKEQQALEEKQAQKQKAQVEDRPPVQAGLIQPPRPAYDILVCELRASDYRTYLRTDAGEYHINAMGPRGYCDRIAETGARVRQPDGRTLYIVPERRAQPPLPPVVLPPIAAFVPPPPTPEPRAQLKPLAELESARIKQELERPIGGPGTIRAAVK